tara:strand:+ start:508 stop:924 length:417 start_codon:yes stop_codon:yes gene_type:complete
MQPRNKSFYRKYGLQYNTRNLVRNDEGYRIPDIPSMKLEHIEKLYWEYRLSATDEALPVWVYWPNVTLYTGEVSKPEIRWRSGDTTDPEYVCLFLEVLQDAQCFSQWLRLEITDGPIGGDKIIRQFATWEEQQHEDAA